MSADGAAEVKPVAAEISEDIDLNWLLTGKRTPAGIPIEPEYNGTTLVEACKMGHLPIIAMFLLAGHDHHARDKAGHQASVMHWVAYYGHAELVNFLIGRGSSVHDANCDGVVPAALLGQENCDTAGQTPLMCCAAGGNVQAAYLLLHYGARLEDKDAAGHSVCFYAVGSPLVLHLFKSQGADLTVRAKDGSSILHRVAATNNYMSAVYLFEKGGWEDADVLDNRKRTPLHWAAQAGHVELIRLLVSQGADVNAVDDAQKTPRTLASNRASRSLLGKLEKEARAIRNASDLKASHLVRPRVQTAEVPSGWDTWKRFFVAFTLPNIVLAVASKLPVILGLFVLLAAVNLLIKVTKEAAHREGRDLSTTGWYMGALMSGSCVVVLKIWPAIYQDEYPLWTIGIWTAITLFMVGCYFRVLIGDPGIVPSSAEQREWLYKMAESGTQPDKGMYCVEAMVRKPNRSKFCKNTQRPVARFDHYCVWLGNAIGAKNHVYFMGFCASQFVSQMFVFYWAYSYLAAAKGAKFGSFCDFCDFLFASEHSLVSFFCVGYNLMALSFVVTVLVIQIRYIGRNLTTNEVWFSRRYPWLIHLGSRVVCLYDSGFFNNWKEFWFGKMHENEFTRPPTSPYINEMIKKYQASLHKRGLPESNVFQAGSAHDGGCCENKHCDVEQGQGLRSIAGTSVAASPALSNTQQASAAGVPQGAASISPEELKVVHARALELLQGKLQGNPLTPGESQGAEADSKMQDFQQVQQQMMAYFATLTPEQQQAMMMQSMQKYSAIRENLQRQSTASSLNANGSSSSAAAPAVVQNEPEFAASSQSSDRKKD